MLKLNKLKKIACVLAVSTALSVGAVCSASDGGDLTMQQKTAATFIDAIDGNGELAYKTFSKGMSDTLKTNINETAYASLQQQVKDNFGTLQEAKFFNYERFDQGDRITYLAAFSNQKMASIVFIFDTDKKLVDFVISPLNAEESK